MKISLQRRHALTIADGSFSHKLDYSTIFLEILNPEGHQNRINGLKVTAILLNGWILPIGGASSGRVCSCSLRSSLVLQRCHKLLILIMSQFLLINYNPVHVWIVVHTLPGHRTVGQSTVKQLDT